MVNWLIALPVVVVLASGTFSALSNKALYDYKSQGSCGYHGFEKPYFLTFAMFVGEALCLVVFHAQEWWSRESSKRWASRVCCTWIYHYDDEDARRRREKEEDALAHGIEPYKAHQHVESFGSAFSDEDMEEQDEEKSLLGQGGAVNAEDLDSHPTYPTLHRRTVPSAGGLLDQDLLDLHLSEEEQRRRRDANKPSKLVYLGLCLFDLTASAIGGIGLVYIDASSNQMLRGSSVVFTAVASRFILRRTLSLKQWSGIMAVVAGLALVGMCGLFRAHHTLVPAAGSPVASHNQVSPSGALLGLMLVLAGSALNSIQNVFEELLVKRVGSDSIDALEIVGWEGVFGTVLTGGIVLPIVQAMPGSNCGSVESTADSWYLLTHSSLVFWLVVGYTLSLAFMNAYSVVLSKEVSAVFRQLINALRVVFIWAISILMFYVWTQRTMGEGWDAYSYFQLAGFALLLLGTIMYGTKETTAEDDATSGVFSPDLQPHDRADSRKEPTAAAASLAMGPDAPEEEVDEYDADGHKKTKNSVAVHIGGGRSDRSAKKRAGDKSDRSVARSPGVETVPLPDVREAKRTPKQAMEQMGTVHATEQGPPTSSRSRRQKSQSAVGLLDDPAPAAGPAEPEQL